MKGKTQVSMASFEKALKSLLVAYQQDTYQEYLDINSKA
jgi:hypothetical protein